MAGIKVLLLVVALALAPASFQAAFAQNCYETGDWGSGQCPISDFPLQWATQPYFDLIGDFAIPLVWGSVLMLLYIRTTNAALVALVGVFIFALILEFNPSVYTNSATGVLFYFGIVAAAVGCGCILFYLLMVKSRNP